MNTVRKPKEPCCVYKSVLGLNLTRPGALDEQVFCPRAQVCWFYWCSALCEKRRSCHFVWRFYRLSPGLLRCLPPVTEHEPPARCQRLTANFLPSPVRGTWWDPDLEELHSSSSLAAPRELRARRRRVRLSARGHLREPSSRHTCARARCRSTSRAKSTHGPWFYVRISQLPSRVWSSVKENHAHPLKTSHHFKNVDTSPWTKYLAP